jgi:SWI/SNF related-matrix-associated actin-dependent regulator of chromatin subfamily C
MATADPMAPAEPPSSDIFRLPSNVADRESDDGPGALSFIERMHNVTNRDAAPTRKRKTPASDDADADEDEPENKKTKTAFNITSTGDTLGNHMKAEREHIIAESGATAPPIDLTDDNEPVKKASEDDEIVFIGESKRDDSREVCLGKLAGRATVFRIPRFSKTSKGLVPKDHWPSLKVHMRRLNIQTHVVDLYDRDPTTPGSQSFGKLDIISAAALCPLIDGSSVSKLRLKIFLDPAKVQKGEFEGARVSRVMPLSIILFSPLDRAQRIGVRLSQRQLFLSQTNPGHGIEFFNPQQPPDFTPNNAKVARRPQYGSQPMYGVARTEEEMMREAEGLLETLFNCKDIPEMEPDPKLILTPLMSHQRQALYFLMQHERADQDSSEDTASGFSLWKTRMGKRGETWYNIITNHELPQKPESMRGGILADMMGLGKTLSILSLITSTLDEAREFGRAVPSDDIPEDFVEINSKATLIICPKSVLSNWQEQVKQHTKPGRLQVYCYHGPSRTQNLDELANYNIVLTSYSTAASEFSDKSKKRNALASIQWFRIVLDEAHQIRTQSTNFFQSCRALAAQRRWVVTGTPVQNRLDDMGALIKFLRLKPFDDGNSWATHVLAPFKSGNENATHHLRLIVHGITLRRLKDKIDLTERREKLIRLDFNQTELTQYKFFSQQSNRQLKLMLHETQQLKGKSYAHMLRSLGRLRAYCAHGKEMLSEEDLRALRGATETIPIELGDEPDNDDDDTFITAPQAYETLQMMIDSEINICTSCTNSINNTPADSDTPRESEGEDTSGSSDDDETRDIIGYLTPCYHLLCPSCKDSHHAKTDDVLKVDNWLICPYCEQYVRFGLFELRRSDFVQMQESRRKLNKNREKAKWDESNYSGPSTKVKALLDDLKQNARDTADLGINEDPIRSVVFSGWTKYLDLIEYALEENDIEFVRLDGTMSLKARTKVIERFKSDPAVTVMLVSIKAGGQGLNFTAASKVYMMEPQFNPGVEQQAIDRVHRLGQKRDVDIVHYIMRESVEEGILKLQEKKTKLAQFSMDRKMSRGEEAKQRIEEIKELFK